MVNYGVFLHGYRWFTFAPVIDNNELKTWQRCVGAHMYPSHTKPSYNYER